MINKEEKKEVKTGKYIYDKKLKKVIKVSDEIVGLRKNNSAVDDDCGSGGCCHGCGCHNH
ncbi:MAG: hypothetical protein KA059_00580 [Elusimicrobiales bacterium]|jgi:hypothetical protein|nr:hypothetical protein [Elusimicrobiales bacterium]NLH38707.1 hypothetical protein [Elusimicrobiota bacterium]